MEEGHVLYNNEEEIIDLNRHCFDFDIMIYRNVYDILLMFSTFVEIPLVAMDEEEPSIESDSYLESLWTEDLSDVEDSDDVNVVSLAYMDRGSQIMYVFHCSLFFEFSISYLKMPLGKFWM